MKRSVASILSTAAAIVALGVCGCGGGLDEGAPKDLTPGVPADQMPKANMGAPGSNKPPPIPKVDAPPTTPEPKKE